VIFFDKLTNKFDVHIGGQNVGISINERNFLYNFVWAGGYEFVYPFKKKIENLPKRY